MFDALGATFGATMAGCLALVGVTGAAVYMFTQWRKSVSERMTFEQLQSIVYEEVRDVCELALVRKEFKSVISVDVDKKIPFLDIHVPGSSRKFLMDYEGTIVCGFDLSGVKISRDGMSNRVKVFLPPSKILDAYADVKSFKIHLQNAGLLASNIKIEEQNAWVAADVEDQRRRAVQEGILLRADDNARQLLTSRIMNRGLNRSFDVEILTLSDGNVRQINPPR